MLALLVISNTTLAGGEWVGEHGGQQRGHSVHAKYNTVLQQTTPSHCLSSGGQMRLANEGLCSSLFFFFNDSFFLFRSHPIRSAGQLTLSSYVESEASSFFGRHGRSGKVRSS